MSLLSYWASLTASNRACLSSGVSVCLLCCWASPIDPASPLRLSSLLLGQSESIQSILPLLWCFILSSLLLGQSDGLQASLPLCWGFMIYSLLLGQSEGIQASLCDLVGLILSANLLGHPVSISTSLPGFVGFYWIGYTDINI